MREKKTLVERYDEMNITRPKHSAYQLFLLYARINALILRIKPVYHFDKKSMKGKQVILIGDHASLDTPLYAAGGYPFVRMNIVLAYHDLFQRFLFRIFVRLGLIPKRQYVTDLRAVRQMVQIIRMGGSLCFFPEGVDSHTGSNHPINPSTIDLLKTFGVTVVLCRNYGAHCAQPFYKKPVMCKGHQELHYEILFTPEELHEKSCDELYQKLMEHIRYRDYQWAAEHGYTYHRRGETNAFGAENMVYLCPKCGREFTINVEDDVIYCSDCGNRIRMDESFALHPAESDSVCPYRNLDDWHKAQRKKMREDVKDPNFSLSFESQLYGMYFDRLRRDQFYVAGEGTVTIDREGLHYKGTRQEQAVNLDFDIKKLPSFLYDRKMTYLKESPAFGVIYYDNELFLFLPKQDSKRMTQYILAVEEFHNLVDPVWDKVSRDAYGED